MRWHLTTYKQDLDSAARQRVVEGTELHLGRGTDCHIQLDDPNLLQTHATLQVSDDGKVMLVSHGPDFWLQGSPVHAASVHPGVTVQVGSWALMFREPDDGFDGALEIVRSEPPVVAEREDAGAAAKRERWRLPRLGPVSAVLFALVVILGLEPLLRGNPNHLDESLRFAYAPGSLHTSHRFFETRCDACHIDNFQAVPSEACETCHPAQGAHADPDEFALELLQARCSTCHPEHVDLDLQAHAEELCSRCHHASGPTDNTLSASDFQREHPPFRVHTATGKALLTEAQDDSSLRFSHHEHLDPEGVQGPDGVVSLTCASCHPADARGEVLPLSMETHCSDCHPLTFLEDDETTTLPHGDTEGIAALVASTLAARAYFDADGEPAHHARQRPGEAPVDDSGARWVHHQAQQSQTLGFGRATCGRCHDVRPTDNGWEVPAREPARFHSMTFSHSAHRVADCSHCHDASTSDDAADVLLPSIEVCRDCHGGEHAKRNRIPTPCTTCHDYHLSAEDTP